MTLYNGSAYAESPADHQGSHAFRPECSRMRTLTDALSRVPRSLARESRALTRLRMMPSSNSAMTPLNIKHRSADGVLVSSACYCRYSWQPNALKLRPVDPVLKVAPSRPTDQAAMMLTLRTMASFNNRSKRGR
jgi:hypothetical protein